MNKGLLRVVSGMIGAGLLFALIVWGVINLLINAQLSNVQHIEESLIIESKKQTEPDLSSLNQEFTLNLASVDFPSSPGPRQSTTKGKKKQESVRLPETVTLSPSPDLIALGEKVFSEETSKTKTRPAIEGDFSEVGGFIDYLESMRQSGGKLVIYDRSGRYGVYPLIELSRDFHPETPELRGYFLERPRLLKKPYLPEVRNVVRTLTKRYPGADLIPALVLPRTTEAFILGALYHALKDDFYDFRLLTGNYSRDGKGHLVFRVLSGEKHEAQGGRPLKRSIEIKIGDIRYRGGKKK